MEIGIIGLGKMGLNLALNLKDQGYQVKGLDLSIHAQKTAQEAELHSIKR